MLRLCPDRPLPPYSYVPGRLPHPISDPAGHSYGLHLISPGEVQQEPVASVSLVSGWQASSDYLFGIDLFNHGFYWEAHETWEQLWIACGRSGREAVEQYCEQYWGAAHCLERFSSATQFDVLLT